MGGHGIFGTGIESDFLVEFCIVGFVVICLWLGIGYFVSGSIGFSGKILGWIGLGKVEERFLLWLERDPPDPPEGGEDFQPPWR